MLPTCNSLCSPSARYRAHMAFPPNEWRRKRMAELAAKIGGKAKLGRMLGYTDGAFVRQMIDGERAISEKTMAAVDRLPGCAGWFEPPAPKTPPSPAASGDPFGALTPDEQRFLADFRILLDHDREHCRQQVAEKAEQMREYLAKLGLPFNRNHLEH